MSKPLRPGLRRISQCLWGRDCDHAVDFRLPSRLAGARPYAGLPRHLRLHARSGHRGGGRDVQRRQYCSAPASAFPGFRPSGRDFRHGAGFGSSGAVRPRPGVLPALQGAVPAPRRHLPVRCGDLDAANGESRRTDFDGVSDGRYLRHARRAAAARAAPGGGRWRSRRGHQRPALEHLVRPRCRGRGEDVLHLRRDAAGDRRDAAGVRVPERRDAALGGRTMSGRPRFGPGSLVPP